MAAQASKPRVWPIATPPFTGHATPPVGATFSADGQRLATAGPDRSIIVWDRDGTRRDALTAPAPVTTSVFHPDGSLMTGDDAGVITVWDVARHAPARTITGHRGAVTSLALTRDGELAASGGADRTIRIWDPAGRSPGRTLPGAHTAAIDAVAFSPDGGILASGGADGRIALWDVEHDRLLATLGDGGSGVKAIAFTPDGRTLATGDAGGTITLWDLDERKRVTTLPGQRGAIRDLAINAEGDLLASAGSDSVITLWDPTTGAHVATLTGHTGPANAVAFGPRGSDALASTGADPRVILWNLNPNAVINRICAERAARCPLP